MENNDVLKEFKRVLRDWQQWIAAKPTNWASLELSERVLADDILKLEVRCEESENCGDFFDHRLEERRLVLYPTLLQAYARYWSMTGTSARMRRKMAELFLLHEWKHVSQHVASSTYHIDGPSQLDVFGVLDYAADAYAIERCFRRYVADEKRPHLKLLVELLEAHLASGYVFGAIASSSERNANVAIDGARVRRQTIWAIQTARARSFPEEAGFDAFGLKQQLTVQLFPAVRDTTESDLCDASRMVAPADVQSPLLLMLTKGDERRIRHLIIHTRELDSFERLIFRQDISKSVDAFRPLFDENPDLVGRGHQGLALPRVPKGEPVTVDAGLATYQWNAAYAPDAALLRADYEVVAFHLRTKELKDFSEWSNNSDELRVRVVTGEGGVGKTRFCRQFARSLLKTGDWRGGFVTWTPKNSNAPSLTVPGQSTLAIIDYAEQSPETLAAVLKALAQKKSKARLILLARTAGAWLDKARRESGIMGDVLQSKSTEVIRFSGIGQNAANRASTAAGAEREFRKRLGTLAVPGAIPEPPNLTNTLLLHATVLSSLLGATNNTEDTVLHWLVERERRFWTEHAKVRALPPYLEPALCEFAAIICAADGAIDRELANTLLGCASLLDGQPSAFTEAVCELFHELYPGSLYLNPVQPDRIKETVISAHMTSEARRRLARI